MTELKSLSKLKTAGKLHYWRGTIEIDEHELHAICDEIQAEHVEALGRRAEHEIDGEDSREKLEKDLKTHLHEFGGYCFNSREGHTDNVDTFFDDFVSLLDRQAAITRADELRGYALSVQNTAINAANLNNAARMDLLDSAWCMNKAADTIDGLRDRLYEQAKRVNEDKRESCESNYDKLFGTPERAAKTLEDACFYCDGKLACDDCVLGKMRGFRDTEDEVEEWLCGDAE